MMKYIPHFTILFVALLVAPFCNATIRVNNERSLAEKNQPWVSSRLPWLIFFGYIALLAGMRSGMNDTSVYINSYRDGANTLQGVLSAAARTDIKYKAWTFLEGFCRLAFGRNNYHLFFLFVATIECCMFVYVMRRQAIDYTIVCFFFFACHYYYNNFSMMRQWLAVTIVFTSISALRDKKFFKYAFICFVGGLFHPSAWFCIPIYFLV